MNQLSTEPGVSRATVAKDFEFLGAIEPFTVFPDRWLSLMAGLMRVESHREGETIFKAGDPSDCVYVVRRGQVVVYTDTVGEPVQLMARVHRGEMFGEVGVLERSRRAVSARASSDAEVLRLEASDLGRLGRASRRFGARLAQSALLRYMGDTASRIELGQRGEVRIRVDAPILIDPADHEPMPTLLDNLSLGGACLRGVPESWNPEDLVALAMLLEDRTELLRVEARVAWRRRESLGLAFAKRSRQHGTEVDAALDVLLASAPREARRSVA